MIIQGRLGRDPEMSQTKSGTAVAKFSVAEDQGWGDNKRTEWHNVVAFGKVAELIGKHFGKGKAILLDDFRITTSKWETDGVKKNKTELILNRVTFLVRDSQTASAPAQASGGGWDGGYGGNNNDKDDLPF